MLHFQNPNTYIWSNVYCTITSTGLTWQHDTTCDVKIVTSNRTAARVELEQKITREIQRQNKRRVRRRALFTNPPEYGVHDDRVYAIQMSLQAETPYDKKISRVPLKRNVRAHNETLHDTRVGINETAYCHNPNYGVERQRYEFHRFSARISTSSPPHQSPWQLLTIRIRDVFTRLIITTSVQIQLTNVLIEFATLFSIGSFGAVHDSVALSQWSVELAVCQTVVEVQTNRRVNFLRWSARFRVIIMTFVRNTYFEIHSILLYQKVIVYNVLVAEIH